MVEKINKCVICNISFVGHHSRKTCSKKCKKKRIKESYKKASKKYRKKITETENYFYKKEKECYCCKEIKKIEEFSKDKYSFDGFTYNCKKCRNQIKKINRERMDYKETRRNYENNKRKKDVFFRLRKNFSSMLWRCLKSNKMSNSLESKMFYLNYDILQLKEHLEKQFDEKMSWENYGTYWAIDHIIPQSKLPFDDFSHPNFIKCWSLDNLQPLEVIENIKKGNKILGEINE